MSTSATLLRGWLRELDLQPGDLVLTGRKDPISRLIQQFTRSPVSHTVVSLGGERLVHAIDDPWQLDESGGGVYELDLPTLASWSNLNAVYVLRPDGIDADRVCDAADDFLANSPPFATTGLGLAGMLVLLNQPIGWGVARAAVGRDVLVPILDRLGDIVADGAQRVMCAELAVRIYAHAEFELALDAPLLIHRMEALRDPAPDRALNRMLRLDPRTRRSLARTTHRGRRAAPLPADHPKTDLDRVQQAWSDALEAIGARRRAAPVGDVADLVVPGDFLRSPSLREIGRLRRRRGGWQ